MEHGEKYDIVSDKTQISMHVGFRERERDED